MKFFAGAFLWVGTMAMLKLTSTYAFFLLGRINRLDIVEMILCIIVGMITWSYAVIWISDSVKRKNS